MKAIRYYAYGSPEVLELLDVETPVPGDHDVLVRVRAAGVNPLDLHNMRGLPYVTRLVGGLRRPRTNGLGAELAGVVEAVGGQVTKFKPGDEVFGGRGMGLVEQEAPFAEYACMPESAMLVAKPANLTFEQAAVVPVAGLSALQALRDKGKVQSGQSVLVNGAAGGVGTFTVQLAKVFGATVTGVCGTGNVELVRSLGADEVIDYTREDFTRSGKRYDVLIDNVGNRSLAETGNVLAPKGVQVGVGLGSTGNWVGPLVRPLALVVRNPFTSRRLTPFLGHNSNDDLAYLAGIIEEGKLTPAIDRTYTLGETADAIRYLETGHAKAKLVITV